LRKKSEKAIPKTTKGKISKIEKQKQGTKFNLYLDSAFAFSIYEETLIKFNLKVDRELSEEESQEILQYEEEVRSLNSAYNLLSIRPRSKAELSMRLSEKYPADLVQDIINNLEKKGLLSDKDFCDFWIKASNQKLKSKRQIQFELYQKKVDSNEIESALKSIDESGETAKAQEIISKFQERYQGLPEKKKKEKLQNILARRGFPYSIIKEVIK
jgi:regulatory protein